ncbi:VirK/YbjX family protein [Yokenella regensburgei]|uniref:VirK/YbjX family protein n=1 Tax=Yokenella regensburgei TaxID=158877 RepID=UPI003F16C93C
MSNISLQTKTLPSTRRQIISELVTGRLIPGPIWRKREYRFKFLLRSLLFWPSTVRMLSALAQRPNFEEMLHAQVTLPSKSHRQYLTLGLNASRRADAIVSHYAWLDSQLSARAADALTATAPQQILQFTGRNEAHFYVCASGAHKAEREGESTLWLYDGNDALLASVTFSVTVEKGIRTLMIGGLQGPRKNVSHEAIKIATKACHGIFPKRLLLEALWQMCASTDIKAMYGVSDNGHVFRAWRYRFSKGRDFHASYDEFWASIEGIKSDKYRWRLPMQMARKPLEDIASKKRAEYRRRFELLDEIQSSLHNFF